MGNSVIESNGTAKNSVHLGTSDAWFVKSISINEDINPKPSSTPKNNLNNKITASNSFAPPETKLLEVISSKAVVIANPGIKIMIDASIVKPRLRSGKTKVKRQLIVVAISALKDSKIFSKYFDLVVKYTKRYINAPKNNETPKETQLVPIKRLKQPAEKA